MKQLFVVLAALLVLPVILITETSAQANLNPNTLPQSHRWPINTDKSYANSQLDTSGTYKVGGLSRLGYKAYFADSAAGKVYVDYRVVGETIWTLKDSVTVAKTAAGHQEWVLRDGVTDKVPGIDIQIRLRKAFGASDNGVTTGTYSDAIIFKP